jgi:hypothetical protein
VSTLLSILALVTMPVPGVGQVVGIVNLTANATLLATDIVLTTQGRRDGGDIKSSATNFAFDVAGFGAGRKTANIVRDSSKAAAKNARASAEAGRRTAMEQEALARASGRSAEMQVRGLRNDAALDQARAGLHDEAAEKAGLRGTDRIKDGFRELGEQRRTGMTPAQSVEAWRIPPGGAGRNWQNREVAIQGTSTALSVAEPPDEDAPRRTGWTG